MTRERIPIFPLNTVLFPGMPLSLQVFEPRYQEMIQSCLARDAKFGVTLIRDGEEVGGPATPCEVGTVSEILMFTMLGDGRVELATVGRERFRILRVLHEQPYLEAEVEFLPSEPAEEPGDLDLLTARVHELATTYVQRILSAHGQSLPSLALPTDPETLSNVLGAVLPVPLPVRQELLESETASRRLSRQFQLLQELLDQQERQSEESQRRYIAFPYRPNPALLNPN